MADLDESQERECFFRLKTYLDLCTSARSHQTVRSDIDEDITVINDALRELLARVDSAANAIESRAHRHAVNELQERLRRLA